VFHPEENETKNKKEKRNIQEPEEPDPGQKSQNPGFQTLELGAPQDRVEKIADGRQIRVDVALSGLNILF
jgi:hypothetical protein